MRTSTQTRPRTRVRPRTARKYIYAIIDGMPRGEYGPLGIDGNALEFISGRGVTSVLSAIDAERIRPERRHLAAHREVLRRLIAQEEAVLPICFGTIAAGPDEVAAMLGRNRAELARQLRRVAGTVEMGLRAVWEVNNIFDYFIVLKPELRAARDRVFGRHGQPTQDEQIELGRTFERLLAQERDAHTRTVEQALSACCAETKRHPPRDEREVMNLACLIRRDRQAAYEAAVFEAASHFDNSFAFDYSGPWAPHSFAEMDIKLSE
jgi:Gas vesicle synthesis protein GvpL/GvpF